MKIKMLRNLLGVEKLAKSGGKAEGQLFASADVSFNMGTILFVGEYLEGAFKVGQKVYFGVTREEVRMDGKDVLVMKEDNVFAIVEDSE